VPTRVCILSDTHGTLDPRVAELAAASDLVVHGGDIGNAAILQLLGTPGERLVAVRGNNDLPGKWPPADHACLAGLPEQAELDLPGGRLAVEHGHRVNPAARRHAALRRRHGAARAVVYGHSHRLICDLDADPWVLNPGAAGRARTFGGPSCLLLHAGRRVWRVETYRFPPP
jgi:putative phosphoesterase